MLGMEPVDYQITVHYNNFIAAYGIDVWLKECSFPTKPVMINLINYYGQNKINEFNITIQIKVA